MAFSTVTLPKTAPDVTKTYAFPKMSALDSNELYFATKNLEEVPISKFQWVDISSPMKLRSIQAKLKLEMITDKLRQKRQEFVKVHRRMTRHKGRITTIDQHVVEIRQKIINMKKLLKERTTAVEALTEDIVKMMDIRRRMKAKIVEYGMYEDFLLTIVMAQPRMYKSPKHVIHRYIDLQQTKTEIATSQQETVDNLSTARDDFKKMLHQNHLQIMGLRNVMDNLLNRYENAKYSSLRSEALIESVKQEGEEKKIEARIVRDSFWKMYQHMQWRKFTDTDFKKEDFKGQLHAINNTLGLLNAIRTRLNERK